MVRMNKTLMWRIFIFYFLPILFTSDILSTVSYVSAGRCSTSPSIIENHKLYQEVLQLHSGPADKRAIWIWQAMSHLITQNENYCKDINTCKSNNSCYQQWHHFFKKKLISISVIAIPVEKLQLTPVQRQLQISFLDTWNKGNKTLH